MSEQRSGGDSVTPQNENLGCEQSSPSAEAGDFLQADDLAHLRRVFNDDALRRLKRSEQEYYATHGHYVPALARLLLGEKAEWLASTTGDFGAVQDPVSAPSGDSVTLIERWEKLDEQASRASQLVGVFATPASGLGYSRTSVTDEAEAFVRDWIANVSVWADDVRARLAVLEQRLGEAQEKESLDTSSARRAEVPIGFCHVLAVHPSHLYLYMGRPHFCRGVSHRSAESLESASALDAEVAPKSVVVGAMFCHLCGHASGLHDQSGCTFPTNNGESCGCSCSYRRLMSLDFVPGLFAQHPYVRLASATKPEASPSPEKESAEDGDEQSSSSAEVVDMPYVGEGES